MGRLPTALVGRWVAFSLLLTAGEARSQEAPPAESAAPASAEPSPTPTPEAAPPAGTEPVTPAETEPAPPTAAKALHARDSADVRPAGSWSVGVFNPLDWSINDDMALRIHPLVALGSPHALIRWAHKKGARGWRVTGEYGLSIPSVAFELSKPPGVKGDLVPACKVAEADDSQAEWCDAPGWIVVPRAGLAASTGAAHVTTLRADVAYGALLSGERGHPLDAFPALDLLMAPALNGWRLRVGGRYDRQISAGLRASGEANFYLVADTPEPVRSPWTVTAHAGVDVKVGSTGRFTLGLMYFNSDQRATEVVEQDGRNQRVSVRSHDFIPTFDFIWEG